MTDDLKEAVIAEGVRLREEAAAEVFSALPLDQPWPARAAWAKWLYDNGDALLSALKAAERPQPVPGDGEGVKAEAYRAFKLAGPLDARTGAGMWAIDTATAPIRPVARCLGQADAERIVAALQGERHG